MEIPRLVHDELLHKLEEPREKELLNEVARLEHGAKILPDDEVHKANVIVDISTEKSPLIKAGTHAMHVDPDFDLYALATKLTIAEKAAALVDLQTSAKAILEEESKHLVGLMVPMMFVVLLESVPEMVVSMMMGHTDEVHSTEILAASSLSSLVQTMLVVGLMNGLGSAIDTICSQAFGAKRFVELWMFIQAGVVVYATCLPLSAIILLNGNWILRALGQDPMIARTASHLLLITLISVPFLLLYSILKSALQAQNIVSPFVKTSSFSWAISLPIAYILGFWTPLGFYGIALSEVLNSAVKSMALLPLVMKTEVFKSSWPGWQWKNAVRLVPKIARLAGSSILMTMFQLLGMSTISLLAGLLPNADIMISANRIFSSLFILTFMPLLGVCVAGAIRIGNALGAGQARRAKLLGRLVMVACFAMSIVGTVLGILIAHPFLRSFTGNPQAIHVASDLATTLLPFVPIGGLLFGIQSMLRACGRQWLCAQLNFLFLFVIAVPLGLYLAISMRMGIAGLWYGNFVGLFGFSLVGGVWWYNMSWETMAKEARRNTHVHVEIDSECEEPEKSATVGL